MSCQHLLSCALSLLASIAAQPDAQRDAQPDATGEPIRVMLRARSGGADRLDPLRYIGGFETKTLIYETLVARGADGRMAPALASRWTISRDRRAITFTLRRGATFHDGSPVTADAVVEHFRRWVGRPEHDWLQCNRRIVDVHQDDARTFTVQMDRPHALLADLCAINPCAILGPTARDWEGEFTRPMGSGPFRFAQVFDEGRRWHLRPTDGDGPPLEVTFAKRRDLAPLQALLDGGIDAFVGGWDEDLPAERLDAIAADERFVVQTARGSSVVYLSFRLDEGPTSELAVRRRIAAAIDRDALIAEVEGGRAEACTSWAAPAVAFWPRGTGGRGAPLPPRPEGAEPIRLRIAAGRVDARAGRAAAAVARQLEQAGFAIEVVEPRHRPFRSSNAVGTVEALDAESGEVRKARGRAVRAAMRTADLRVQITHGVPYDPHRSLTARFGPKQGDHPDSPQPRSGVPKALAMLIARAMAEPDEMACLPVYAAIQTLMDHEALIVPLYVPHRIALHRREVTGIALGIDVYRVDLTGLRRRE